MSRPVYIFLFLSAFAACTKTTTVEDTATGGRTVLQIVQNSFQVSLFNAALEYTGLSDSLNGPGPYTIFAPSDAAFDSMGITSVAQIDTMDKVKLTHLLKYHILYGQTVRLADVDKKVNNPFVDWDSKTLYISRPYNTTTYNSTDLTDFLTVNGDTVVQEDILATNGVVHTLKNVLKYQSFNTCADLLNADTNYSYFVTALKNFNLYSQLQTAGPVTVFAPVNSAFIAAGIDLDSLQQLDTLHFIKLLFQPYICPNLRFFSTDLVDFASPFVYYPPGNGYSVSITLVATWPNPNPIPTITAIGLDPVTHDPLLLAPTNAYYSWTGPTMINIDNPAGNGVVQAINGLYALPSYCTIHQ
ncbi:MAG TPA: fasciclin domain-containing protein [Puia sp.]|nr:fasciclin domain-containing protein [Puia sp.]